MSIQVKLSARSSSPSASASCAIASATVFSDARCEVTRAVKTKLTTAAAAASASSDDNEESSEWPQREIVIEHLPVQVDLDSVRVGALSSTGGRVRLLEVVPSTVTSAVKLASSDDNSSGGKNDQAQRQELDALRKARKVNRTASARLIKQRVWLEKYSEEALVTGARSSDAAPLLDSTRTAQAAAFLAFKEEQEAGLDARDQVLELELEELDAKIAVLDSVLQQRANPTRVETTTQVVIVIGVNADANAELEVTFDLTYVVRGRSNWVPTYDCRVNSRDESAEITYLGAITNSTGEDWSKIKLSLSTAKPSKGGAPPELPRLKAQWKVNVPVAYRESRMAPASFGAAMPMVQSMAPAKALARNRQESESAPVFAAEIIQATVTSAEGSSSATYGIPHAVSIPSDHKSHKVSIAIIELKDPRFSYQMAPSANTTAFLKVSAQNGSPFSMLPGKVNIFLDGAFVSTSELSAVPPGDKFALFLGPDELVVCDFKPVKVSRQRSGLITKTDTETVSHVITVKNTKKRAIFCTVVDSIPRSETDQIKVKVIEPDLDDLDESRYVNVKLTKNDHVEFRLNIEPGQTATIPLDYTIEWPASAGDVEVA